MVTARECIFLCLFACLLTLADTIFHPWAMEMTLQSHFLIKRELAYHKFAEPFHEKSV